MHTGKEGRCKGSFRRSLRWQNSNRPPCTARPAHSTCSGLSAPLTVGSSSQAIYSQIKQRHTHTTKRRTNFATKRNQFFTRPDKGEMKGETLTPGTLEWKALEFSQCRSRITETQLAECCVVYSPKCTCRLPYSFGIYPGGCLGLLTWPSLSGESTVSSILSVLFLCVYTVLC